MRDLAERLDRLAPGEIELLSKAQFDAIFSKGSRSEEQAKREGVAFAEQHRCRVLFGGRAELYAVFKKLQNGASSARRD